jgi:hypothetical protein
MGGYIIVEATIFISPDVEEIECEFGVEVLELDENSGPSFLHGMHEFLNEFLCFGVGDTLLSETKV